ncbi:MAG: nitrogenase-stabilizing/protective protein NifW [Candidatus Competibacteraceae bacterium]|nr:nitrogenase-stabilizing/protective protein NifW [Candidatus Competibacteraceae bacterium]
MNASTLQQELSEMASAEDFLHYFEIAFDAKVVEVNRLHILQRFRDYLRQTKAVDRTDYARALKRAYEDFVHSDALTEKVFKVFHRQSQGREVRIAVADIGRVT